MIKFIAKYLIVTMLATFVISMNNVDVQNAAKLTLTGEFEAISNIKLAVNAYRGKFPERGEYVEPECFYCAKALGFGVESPDYFKANMGKTKEEREAGEEVLSEKTKPSLDDLIKQQRKIYGVKD